MHGCLGRAAPKSRATVARPRTMHPTTNIRISATRKRCVYQHVVFDSRARRKGGSFQRRGASPSRPTSSSDPVAICIYPQPKQPRRQCLPNAFALNRLRIELDATDMRAVNTRSATDRLELRITRRRYLWNRNGSFISMQCE